MEFSVFKERIHAIPKIEDVKNGIAPSDLKHGFEDSNFGCDVSFEISVDSPMESCLITWADVFHGGKTGLQIWTRRDEFSNLSLAFENKKKTELGLSQLVNVFEVELCDDRVQLAALSNCHFRSTLNFRTSQLSIVQSSNKTNNVSIKDKKVQPLLDSIEKNQCCHHRLP